MRDAEVYYHMVSQLMNLRVVKRFAKGRWQCRRLTSSFNQKKLDIRDRLYSLVKLLGVVKYVM